MESIVIEISKFIIIFLMTIYTFLGFVVISKKNTKKQRSLYQIQRSLVFLNHFICNLVLYLNVKNTKILLFYLAQLGFLIGVTILYALCYRRISQTIMNHMLMLFSISFVMLERLSYDSAVSQFRMACAGVAIGLVVPVIIQKLPMLKNMEWLYGILGVGFMGYVAVFGTTIYGAKNWVSIGGRLIQPSEFVKIIFVFFVAASLAKVQRLWNIFIISAVAGLHVLLLVWERDLGGALIFFLTYVMMLYIATGKSFYLFGGLAGASAASAAAYQLFPHVRVRVSAWLNPWSSIDGGGYQIAQSLFAIGTGGWFGMGIGKGLPTSIPVGKSDFIYSAISEEFGGIFALWFMFIYVSCFVAFIIIAIKAKELFYKYLALGFSVMFIVQVFLCIGGVTKCIPSTGVTLPLVSYGGSSVISTSIIFSILQGIYLMNQREEGKVEKEKRKVRRTSQRQGVSQVQDV